jgi:hypothetical protein
LVQRAAFGQLLRSVLDSALSANDRTIESRLTRPFPLVPGAPSDRPVENALVIVTADLQTMDYATRIKRPVAVNRSSGAAGASSMPPP